MGSKVRYMDESWCAIYKYRYGRGHVPACSTGIGLFTGSGISILSLILVNPSNTAMPLILLVCSLPVVFISCHVILNFLFFIDLNEALKQDISCMFTCATQFSGIQLLMGFLDMPIGLAMMAIGIPLVALGWGFLSRHLARMGRIQLFTDGIIIGNLRVKYEQCIDVQYATRDIDGNLPVTARDKPMQVLTPIEYEYTGKDFGFFHHFAIIVLPRQVLIVQSSRKRGAFVQNLRNGYACDTYNRRHGIDPRVIK
ncbi:hypothetical protein GF325_10395 [Candidatus Bathyarchaeota archaeon]|nr:hypothetical protein [Candidatus Bathyarchaeota archaeon]